MSLRQGTFQTPLLIHFLFARQLFSNYLILLSVISYSAKLQDELKAEVSQSAPAPETITTPRFQSRAALGLMARLAAKYGKVYVSKTLPKIVYKKVAKLIGKKVSQAKFLHIWNNTIGVAAGAALESAIAKGLKACGVPKGIANTAATIIATAVGILV